MLHDAEPVETDAVRVSTVALGSVSMDEPIEPLGLPRVVKVHVVDDEELIVKVTSRFLRQSGYHATHSTNPLEVCDLLRRDPDAFHVLVTDLDMPELHGHELIKRLLAIRPELVTIVLTGTMPTTGLQVADWYLLKPCTPESLTVAIAKSLERKVSM